MAVNWGLGVAPDVGGNALAAFERGRAQKQEENKQNALAAYAGNPDDPKAFQGLVQYHPQLAMEERGRKQQAEANAANQHREQMKMIAKILDNTTDDATYQQGLATARQLGIDVSKAPPAYDPAWVNEMKGITAFFSQDGTEHISGIARELQDAGYKPGTPQFAEAMRGVIQNKYAADYVDEQGNTRRRSALALPGGPPAGGLQIPSEAAAELRANPGTAAQFDEVFGQGAAARILGGGGSNVTGGFPQ